MLYLKDKIFNKQKIPNLGVGGSNPLGHASLTKYPSLLPGGLAPVLSFPSIILSIENLSFHMKKFAIRPTFTEIGTPSEVNMFMMKYPRCVSAL